MWVESTPTTISGSTFSSNQAVNGNGGALFFRGVQASELKVCVYIYEDVYTYMCVGFLFPSFSLPLLPFNFCLVGCISCGFFSLLDGQISTSSFTSNVAVTGGALYATGVEATVSLEGGSSFLSNSASSGGAVCLESLSSASLTGPNLSFGSNSAPGGTPVVAAGAPGRGGALYVLNCNALIQQASFQQNSAVSGGGIYLEVYCWSRMHLMYHALLWNFFFIPPFVSILRKPPPLPPPKKRKPHYKCRSRVLVHFLFGVCHTAPKLISHFSGALLQPLGVVFLFVLE